MGEPALVELELRPVTTISLSNIINDNSIINHAIIFHENSVI